MVAVPMLALTAVAVAFVVDDPVVAAAPASPLGVRSRLLGRAALVLPATAARLVCGVGHGAAACRRRSVVTRWRRWPWPRPGPGRPAWRAAGGPTCRLGAVGAGAVVAAALVVDVRAVELVGVGAVRGHDAAPAPRGRTRPGRLRDLRARSLTRRVPHSQLPGWWPRRPASMDAPWRASSSPKRSPIAASTCSGPRATTSTSASVCRPTSCAAVIAGRRGAHHPLGHPGRRRRSSRRRRRSPWSAGPGSASTTSTWRRPPSGA